MMPWQNEILLSVERVDMIFKSTTIKCPCCQKVFCTEYSHGGSIEHENTYSNMHVLVNRWDFGFDKEKLFLWAINLDGNHCNIKDNTIKVGREIFFCVLLWLQKNMRDDIYIWLKAKENEIPERYNEVRRVVIEDLKKQIEQEEKRIES